MEENKFSMKVEEWINLNNQGLFIDARKFYFEELFDDIISRFIEKTQLSNSCDVLFSILGYTPEPIILTQRALTPSVHVIFTTNKSNQIDTEIVSYLEKYLTSNYKIVNLPNEDFDTIYSCMKEQMILYPASKYIVDVTGGKKSMVASAAIFARDYNSKVVYVDYEEYLSDLRRPRPGSEKLDIVYDIEANLDSIVDFAKKRENNRSLSSSKEEESKNLRDRFNDEFEEFFDKWNGKTMANVEITMLSERSVRLSVPKHLITCQRTQLWQFYMKCCLGEKKIGNFIDNTSQYAKYFNPVIKVALENIDSKFHIL